MFGWLYLKDGDCVNFYVRFNFLFLWFFFIVVYELFFNVVYVWVFVWVCVEWVEILVLIGEGIGEWV